MRKGEHHKFVKVKTMLSKFFRKQKINESHDCHCNSTYEAIFAAKINCRWRSKNQEKFNMGQGFE